MARTSRTSPPSSTAGPLSRRQYLAWTAGAGLLAALPGCGGDDSGGDNERYAGARQWGQQAVREAMNAASVRAASVALLVGPDVVWQEAFGVTDEQAATAATVDTRFNIGSVSKVICALAATVLVDRGLVALDTPVAEYLPQFSMLSPEYRKISLRHLLSHQSGLPGTNMRNLFATTYMPGYAARQLAWLADFHLKHAPGEMAVYCNDGFTVVESVVRAVTGQTYAEFVQSAILAPLGMGRSAFVKAPLPEGSFAHGYRQGQRQAQEYVMDQATGGLTSTPGDMMKLARMFLNKGMADGVRVVSAAGLAEMGRPQTLQTRLNPVPEWQCGLGWDSTRQPGLAVADVRCWQKNGGTMLFGSDFFVLPDDNMAFMVTGSGLGYNPGAIAEGVLLRALQAKGRLARLPDTVSTTVPDAADAAPEAVAPLLGIYASSKAPVKATSDGGARIDLHQWTDEGWTSLVEGLRLRTDGWWWSTARPSVSYRWTTIEGHAYLLQRERAPSGYYRETQPLGETLPAAPSALPAAWSARLNTSWRVTDEDPSSLLLPGGQGVFTLRELPELPGYLLWNETQLLRPTSDTRAEMTVKVPMNNGRDLTELIFLSQGGKDLLRADGWVLERLTA